MTYLTLAEINSNPIYAPLDYENEFLNRIKKEIHEIVKNLDITKTITFKHVGVHYESINQLLDPNTLERYEEHSWRDYEPEEDFQPGSWEDFQPEYRAGTTKGSTWFFASWNQKPERWKREGCHYHRNSLKSTLLRSFDYYYSWL